MGIFDGLFKPNVEKLKKKRDVEGLLKALGYKGKNVRLSAAEALGKIQDAMTVGPLIRALKDKDSDVRGKAIWALGEIGDAKAVGPLIWALKDNDSGVRERAKWALGEIGDARAVVPLIRALKDKDSDVRKAAKEYLGEIGDARAVEPLIQALANEYVREKAEKALEKIGEPAVEPLIQALKYEYYWVGNDAAARVLGKVGNARAVKPLILAFKDRNEEYYGAEAVAVDAIKEIGEPAVEPLIQALKDADGKVREMAAESLGKIKDVRAVEPLIQALKDKNRDVQVEAVDALGEIGDKRAVEPLQVQEDKNSAVANALVKLGDKRSASARIDDLFDHPREVIQSDDPEFSSFKPLFEDYTDLIHNVAGYYSSGHSGHNEYITAYTYPLDKNKKAVKALCGITSPISSNILHKVANMRDVEVTLSWSSCGDPTKYGTLSFEPLRKMAKEELERRGNPPYDPSAYLKKDAGKL
jgi:HEAT repeat protein